MSVKRSSKSPSSTDSSAYLSTYKAGWSVVVSNVLEVRLHASPSWVERT